MDIRVGYGYDVHAFKANHPFIIGGVKIEHHQGAFGHSDADVLVHAICDALLGSLNLRDIGFHFPDTDSAFKNIDSLILLKKVGHLVKEKGYTISNMDCTICLETPKLNPHIPEMAEKIAKTLGIEDNRVSIKATTSEKLGFVGEEKGISAHCAVLVMKA
jgi:2-C-methyl-D-erythritol 2,4-cyclodiphosphate synthase